MSKYFEYGIKEIEYLKKKDKKLSLVIDRIGFIKREIEEDIFSALISHIVGQQISNKAHATIWARFKERFNPLDVKSVCDISLEELQSIGISFKKAAYIKKFAEKIQIGELNIDELKILNNEEVIKKLVSLDGIGVWTAQMLLIFSLKRYDVLSFGDFAIIKGLKKLYGHKEINKNRFEIYRKRYSPYGSVASFYLWAISNDDFNL